MDSLLTGLGRGTLLGFHAMYSLNSLLKGVTYMYIYIYTYTSVYIHIYGGFRVLGLDSLKKVQQGLYTG